jgi:hypothetical protein
MQDGNGFSAEDGEGSFIPLAGGGQNAQSCGIKSAIVRDFPAELDQSKVRRSPPRC